MKIDSSQGNIEVYGDIKEFKTSIDPKNLEFITTLLSSNLYSDPEQSFIREIVSNAWDSHVEAGTTDIPVIIRFKNDVNEKSITIRDYGVGLSPERFQTVYCNIGSSTKRESNDFIGGFGIGKYSSLACSNTVYIVSYYEGKSYHYVMVKSGNSITTNLVMENPTTEKNGVEVTIKNIDSIGQYKRALQFIVFFPNIYVDGIDCDINTTKVKKFNNFAVASSSISSKLLLGNVLYPCNDSLLSSESKLFLYNIRDTGIVVKFDVGEINITPNRESIIYSSDTVSKIESRILEAQKELELLTCKKIGKDYTDIFEYQHTIDGSVFYDPLTDSVDGNVLGYRVDLDRLPIPVLTYRGKNLQDYRDVLFSLVFRTLPNFKGVVGSDRLYKKYIPCHLDRQSQMRTDKLVILRGGSRMFETVKSYLKLNYYSYGIMLDLTYDEFKKYIKEELGKDYADTPEMDLIVQGLYESLKDKGEVLDIENDEKFLAYKEELSALNKNGTKVDYKEVIFHLHRGGYAGYSYKERFKNLYDSIEYLKRKKTGIILGTMDANDELYNTLAALKGYVFIKARKDVVDSIMDLGLSCIVDKNWLLKEDPNLSVALSIMNNFPKGLPSSAILKEIYLSIDDALGKELKRICQVSDVFCSNSTYRIVVKNNKDLKPDPYTDYLCAKFKKIIEGHKAALDIVHNCVIYGSQPEITAAVIMKTKAYRINSRMYRKMKKNDLIRILCRK